MLDGQPELFIHIIPDKSNNTITIVDSGIGMTKVGSHAALGIPPWYPLLCMHPFCSHARVPLPSVPADLAPRSPLYDHALGRPF